MKTTALTTTKKLPRIFEDLVRLFPPAVIRDRADCENTQEMIDRLTSVPKLSAGQSRYLDTLATLMHAYEIEHFEIETNDLSGLASLRFLMDQHEMSSSDLGRLLGERSLGSKILGGDRELSKAHIRTLAGHFGVSPSLFL
jgi:HTH-type transcriptional regulator/antitoxin HigA